MGLTAGDMHKIRTGCCGKPCLGKQAHKNANFVSTHGFEKRELKNTKKQAKEIVDFSNKLLHAHTNFPVVLTKEDAADTGKFFLSPRVESGAKPLCSN